MTATITGRSHRIPRVRTRSRQWIRGRSRKRGLATLGHRLTVRLAMFHGMFHGMLRKMRAITRKHIVVPDLSDDTDPWANDGGNSMPVDGVRGGDAPGTPQNVAHAQSQSREDSERTNPGPTAVPESMSAEDPWLACVISRFRFVEHRRAKRRLPGSSPRAFRRLGCTRRPENPGVEPGTTHLQQTPGAAAGQRASRPAYDDTDPFAGADPYAQEDIPMPTVAPEDDEYSMNDVSLGSPETMSLDDVKQFFEVVKPVEEYGPDDPKNPRNIQHVNKHDSE